ncbi:MAG: hypothetical protein ABIS50_15250 [Luteolibacter sp.]
MMLVTSNESTAHFHCRNCSCEIFDRPLRAKPETEPNTDELP